MITIQELHAYQKLVEAKIASAIFCFTDSDHGSMIPWVIDENPCFKCLACNCTIYPGLQMIQNIRDALLI